MLLVTIVKASTANDQLCQHCQFIKLLLWALSVYNIVSLKIQLSLRVLSVNNVVNTVKFILSIGVLTMTNLVHIVSFHNCHYDQSVYNFVNIIFIMSTVSQQCCQHCHFIQLSTWVQSILTIVMVILSISCLSFVRCCRNGLCLKYKEP